MTETPQSFIGFFLLAIFIFFVIGYFAHGFFMDMQEKKMTELDVKCNISPFHSLTNTTGYILVKCKAPLYQDMSMVNITIEESG